MLEPYATEAPSALPWGEAALAEPDETADHVPPAMPNSRPGRELLWPRIAPAPSPVADQAPGVDGFWASGPETDEALQPKTRSPRWRPRLRQVAWALGSLAVLAAVAVAGTQLLPALFGSGRSETAVFNAPMMVVRSAVTGRVMTVAANAGQVVEPASRLLTIQSDASGPDRAVLAGIHGVIRSVETVPGADIATGAPLVRMQDCDRAFLTVAPGTKLRAGEAVRVKLPDLPVIGGTVRAASGIMEPPNTLVVGIAPGTLTSACPVGASTVVTPAVQG